MGNLNVILISDKSSARSPTCKTRNFGNFLNYFPPERDAVVGVGDLTWLITIARRVVRRDNELFTAVTSFLPSLGGGPGVGEIAVS